MTTARSGRPATSYALSVLCVGAIVAAILLVGPASGSQTTEGPTITVGEGVVQSTVSGSGNVQAASELDLGFKTSGVVSEIYVSQGQHVTEGQLIAELDPKSAEVTLEQAKANLQAAEAKLVEEQETDGATGTDSGSGASGSGASASAASTTTVAGGASASAATTTAAAEPPNTTPSSAAPSSPAPTTQTTPVATTPTPSSATKTTSGKARGPASARTDDSSQRTGSTRSEGSSTETGTTQGTSSVTGSTAAKATVSAALREANLASAKAAVRSDALAVQNDEKALANTKLLAPQTGTIVSLAGEVGETVSGGGTTKSSSSSSGGSSGSGSGANAASSTGAGVGASTDSSGSSGSGSSSSSSFAVLSDLSSMQLVVPLSESEVGSVRAGQPATVTVEALESAKLAAHVVSVATLPTSTSGVVSYDVTFQLDQLANGLKPGMSATAEVVVKQAEGVNVPTTAISAETVTVVRDGKQVRERVVTGLAGDSSTIVLSGLKAGEEIVLPVARSSASSLASRLGGALSSRLGGGTLGGAGGGLAGAGGAPGGFAGGGGFRGG
jgi:HlyD family secretion protein